MKKTKCGTETYIITIYRFQTFNIYDN